MCLPGVLWLTASLVMIDSIPDVGSTYRTVVDFALSLQFVFLCIQTELQHSGIPHKFWLIFNRLCAPLSWCYVERWCIIYFMSECMQQSLMEPNSPHTNEAIPLHFIIVLTCVWWFEHNENFLQEFLWRVPTVRTTLLPKYFLNSRTLYCKKREKDRKKYLSCLWLSAMFFPPETFCMWIAGIF